MTKTSTTGYKVVSKALYEGKAQVSEENSNETIEVADFQGEPTGYVAVSAHYTKNLGNYESARIGIEVMLPVQASEQAIIEGYDRVQTLVTEILNEQVAGLSN